VEKVPVLLYEGEGAHRQLNIKHNDVVKTRTEVMTIATYQQVTAKEARKAKVVPYSKVAKIVDMSDEDTLEKVEQPLRNHWRSPVPEVQCRYQRMDDRERLQESDH